MSHTVTRRLVPAVMAVAVLVAVLGAGVPASASPTSPLKCSSPSATVPYQGGPVKISGFVRLIYWGSYWAGGGQSAQLYLDHLFENLGNSSWTRTVSQYCDTSGDRAAEVQGTNLLTGEPGLNGSESVVVDTTNPVPSHPTPSNVADEAIRESGPMLTPNLVDGAGWPTLIVVTPPGVVPQAEVGNHYCGEHFMADYTDPSGATSPDLASVIDLPWGKISKDTNCFGGGLPALSVTAGHEWAEAVTDPEFPWTADTMYPATSPPAGFTAAWTTLKSGGEIGDRCQLRADFTLNLGGYAFQMPQLWSNDASSGSGSCVKTS